MNLYPTLLSEDNEHYKYTIDVIPPKGELFLKLVDLVPAPKSSLEMVAQELKSAAPYKTTTHERNEPMVFEVVGFNGHLNSQRLEGLKVGDKVLIDASTPVGNLMGTNTHTYVSIDGVPTGPGVLTAYEHSVIAIVREFKLNPDFKPEKRAKCIKTQVSALVKASTPGLVL